MIKSNFRLFNRVIVSIFTVIFLLAPIQVTYAEKLSRLDWFEQFFESDKKIIVIDAGHGGTDPGSIDEGIEEKDINLQIAIKLKEAMLKKGYQVVMTRYKDVAISLHNRAKLANQSKGDIFISIHQNSFKDSSIHGIEIFYNPDKGPLDKKLASCLQESLINQTKAKNRQIRSDRDFVVIRESNMPACLIESAYLSNEKERNLIITDEYQNKIVDGIIQGIETFFNQEKR